MGKIVFYLLLILFVYGDILDFKTLKADFTQTLTNDKNNTITYQGTLFIKKPFDIVWDYKKPIKKTIYITSYQVVVFEPEIYQAIITKNSKEINPLKILKNAKKISSDLMVSRFKDKEYKIFHNSSNILKITFKDIANNNVKIIFNTYQKNIEIDDKVFIFTPSLDIDIIRN